MVSSTDLKAARLAPVSVSVAKEFLVELADAGSLKLIDKQNCVRHPVFRDNSLICERADKRLDLVLGQLFGDLMVADDESQRALAPFLVLNADDGNFSHSRRLPDDVFKLQRGDPFTSGLHPFLDPLPHLQTPFSL